MRLTKPVIGDAELAAVAQVLESGYLTQGPKAAEFGSLVATYVGSRYGLATSSCTAALHLALVALDVQAGDEVIVPNLTFPATANVVLQQGAIPVLVDIEPETFTLDPDALERAFSPRTKVVIPVHAFGLCADMDPINELAAGREITVVEDAACALGASYDGRMAGSLGTVAAFSFHPRKILTTGEGGVLTTNDERIESRVSLLCSHGGRRSDLFFEFEDAGFNYRLSDINAAIGIVQMSRLEDLLTRRRNVAALYSHLLGSVSGVNPPTEPARRTHAYQSYVTILEDGIDRDRVIRHLRDQGVESTLGTYALSQQPYMKKVLKVASEEFPVADRIARQSLTLPLHPEMSSDDVALVLHALKAALAAN